MNPALLIERLRDDEGLTDNLGDDEAEVLLQWGERRLALCASEEEAGEVIGMIRAVNREAGRGGRFAELFSQLPPLPEPPAPSGDSDAAAAPEAP